MSLACRCVSPPPPFKQQERITFRVGACRITSTIRVGSAAFGQLVGRAAAVSERLGLIAIAR